MDAPVYRYDSKVFDSVALTLFGKRANDHSPLPLAIFGQPAKN